jgi:hypothetical protein
VDPASVVWAIVVVLLVIAVGFAGRGKRGRSVGPGTIGANYDFLSRDKREAIEYIVEEKAEARDPENADGNLPDLEKRNRK